MAQTPLLDAPLVPDPYEALELGAPFVPQALTDEEIRGCRVLLYQADAEPLPKAGGGVLGLQCSFQAAHGARFIHAVVTLELTSPDEVRFIDVAPAEVQTGQAVKMTLKASGTLGATLGELSAGADASTEATYERSHCRVTGSGASTRRAKWVFEEDPIKEDGLGAGQALAVSIDGTGTIEGSLYVMVHVQRAGLRGVADAFRRLVFGSEERRLPVAFEIPTQPSPSGLARFFGRG